jgi:hypothetical protein
MSEVQEVEHNDIEELKKIRDHYRAKAFHLALGILAIFGVPAGLAVVAGRAMDSGVGSGRKWQMIFLGLAFFLSWFMLILVWRKIDKGMREVDDKIKKSKHAKQSNGLLKPY